MRLSLCLGASLLLVLPLPARTQDRPDLLANIFNRHHPECGRRGLCPYVKRLIPHTFGYGVDSGHVTNPNLGFGPQHEPPSLCGNLCASDHACPGYQKCCPTNCGYACFDPVYIVEH